MKPNDAMTPGRLAALLLMAFLGGVAAYIVSVVRNAEPATPPEARPNILDGEIISLDRIALDSAYRAQMAILFSTWMKDPQFGPKHAMTGARWTRQAYLDVREALDKREAEFNARFGYVEKQCK